MKGNSSLEQVVELEQHFIDNLKPNLNVDLVANGSGHHEPMSQEMREKLRKQRGTPVYMYTVKDLVLLYAFDSKQQAYDLINIHHNTLNDCLNLAKSILAEFKNEPKKNLEFNSLNSLAKHLKGDRQVIREYLKGEKSGYYRALFGSYKHDGDLLTSAIPGVETVAETIGDIAAIAKDISTSTDPIKMEIAEAMRSLRQYDLGPMKLFSYHDILSRILISGSNLEVMDSKCEAIFSDNAKNMMETLKNVVADCRKEVSEDYGHKLKLADTLSKPNTDLMREVQALLERNPFDRPQ
nr:hypothetical protein [Tanacetum cinerariifolium]